MSNNINVSSVNIDVFLVIYEHKPDCMFAYMSLHDKVTSDCLCMCVPVCICVQVLLSSVYILDFKQLSEVMTLRKMDVV